MAKRPTTKAVAIVRPYLIDDPPGGAVRFAVPHLAHRRFPSCSIRGARMKANPPHGARAAFVPLRGRVLHSDADPGRGIVTRKFLPRRFVRSSLGAAIAAGRPAFDPGTLRWARILRRGVSRT